MNNIKNIFLRLIKVGRNLRDNFMQLLVLLRPGLRDEKHDLVTTYHFKTLETKNCHDHHWYW